MAKVRKTDRDRDECHARAVQQTGVHPSLPNGNPYARVVVQPATPPGANVAAGAVTGGILGSIIAGPWHSGTGFVRRRHGCHRRRRSGL